MILKHYYGNTRDEAIELAQQEFGERLVVLQTETPKRSDGQVGISVMVEPEPAPKKPSSALGNLRKIALGMDANVQTKLRPKPTNETKRDTSTTTDSRLEALEYLFKASLANYELEYANHPIFKQLVASGIPTKTVMQWFLKVSDDLDSVTSSDSVLLKRISQLIVQAVGTTSDSLCGKKNIYFGGSSAGKTSLIMSLIDQLDPSIPVDEIGICSLSPKRMHGYNYSILPQYAHDKGIDFALIEHDSELEIFSKSWSEKNYLFIDTPSIQLSDSESEGVYGEIIEWIKHVPELQKHWVQNAQQCSIPSTPTHWISQHLNPDYLCFTHMDLDIQWGPILVFMKNLPTNTRLLKVKKTGEEALHTFNPRWFVGKLLNQV
jgi:hypothetical protein